VRLGIGLPPTPAFLQAYRPNLVGGSTWFNGLIRLKAGQADLPAFRSHLADVVGRSGLWVDDRHELRRSARGDHIISY
jgi:hypothetical protein